MKTKSLLNRSEGSLSEDNDGFTAHTLPVLEKHNQMAKEINAALK